MGNIQASLIRQPPPPPLPSQHSRSLIAASEEDEEAVEIAGGTYYLTRWRMRISKSFISLHDDLLFEVLTRVPAQDIYDAAMYVCRKWYRIIHTHKFINAHLRHSTHGLLFHCPLTPTLFMVARQGQLEISYLTKLKHRSSASCNGLLLEIVNNQDSWTPYILNPITKQIFVLPKIKTAITLEYFAISYVATSMVYKVVAVVGSTLKILTVGVDNSWRTVCIKHCPLEAFTKIPRTTEGFVHWVTRTTVLTLNVETEMVEESSEPIPQLGALLGSILVSTGSKLSFLIKFERFGWHVWEMEPESKEWRKLHIVICLKDHKRKFQRWGLEKGKEVYPIGWIKYKELLVLIPSGVKSMEVASTIFVYNLVTHEVVKKDLPDYVAAYSLIRHQNSLVWLPGSS
ncbi:unnamed protein product [Cuscuta epithymum]|uniref:F-box domain-containing protein n=1 Tax=Cuscuta epithymum TaxID=186058 RepID=A0AAV0D7V0_9ASTE|nr:unnamed protein product [Cuscuta epithymum]CAH9142180.1 unnamed protein product [Cuscuta epithymum]